MKLEAWIPPVGEEVGVNSIWTEEAFNTVNILMGCPVLSPELAGGELSGTGHQDSEALDPQEGESEPDIKPPLPQEVPAPQSPQPDIAPYQAPPAVTPNLPQPEA